MVNLVTVVKASEILGVSADTIRRWDKKSLIRSTRDNNNYRVFKIDELKHLHDKLTGKYKGNDHCVLKTNRRSPYTCIELFAGAGGTSLGLDNAGISHSALVENNKDCVATLRDNRPNWNVIDQDIRDVDFKGMSADIVQGGFPCQAFSYAGRSMGFEDTRGTLFFEFARCIKEVRPKIAIGENVRGLESHNRGKTLLTMLNALEEIGYKATYKILRSQYFNVPQKRERLIIIAVRKDLDIPFAFPKEQNYIVSLKEAIGDRPKAAGQKYTKAKAQIMKLIPAGGCWRDLPPKIQKQYMGASYHLEGGKTGMARRLSWEEPSLTLTCNPAQKQTERCHPEQTRPLNIREYARIQTFPDDWKFTGSVSSQYKQIGNAVPVNLAYHLGQCLIAMLNQQFDTDIMDLVVDSFVDTTKVQLELV